MAASQVEMSVAAEPSPAAFKLIDNKYLVDEETLHWYSEDDFYPVQLGDVFGDKYQVIGKLGFGSVSTVWMCKDLSNSRYVAVKVFISRHRQSRNEDKVLRHIDEHRKGQTNAKYVRTLLDQFEIPGVRGPHQCLVQEPLAMTIADLSKVVKLTLDLVQPIIQHVTRGLQFLHTVADVVHTDIQLTNIMMTLPDLSLLQKYETKERDEPSSRKIENGRTIYASRSMLIPKSAGTFVICDFGESQFGAAPYTFEVMPDLYRAPEILLGIPWDHKIDIWALGMVLWHLIQGVPLFRDNSQGREGSTKTHLARMIALLGHPPKELLKLGSKSATFFDSDGNFIDAAIIPNVSLESELTTLEGEEKSGFLELIRELLQWQPQDRPSAEALLKEPWLAVDSWTLEDHEQSEEQSD